MAATYNKFDCFVQDLLNKLHDLFGTGGSANTAKVYLTNAAPAVTNTVYNTPADLSTAGGYTAGGSDVTVNGTVAGSNPSTYTLTGTAVVFTATAAGIGPFRYIVLYNFTAAAQNLIAWWDYGSNLTLADTETLTIKFNSSATTGTIFTLV